MTIKQAFAQFMETNNFGVIGDTIFIGNAPLDSNDGIWWIISSGGNNISKNNTGEKQKNYILSIYYRNINARLVDSKVQLLEELINENACIDIPPYVIIEAEANAFPSDEDLDDEDRTVGLVQITLTVYK